MREMIRKWGIKKDLREEARPIETIKRRCLPAKEVSFIKTFIRSIRRKKTLSSKPEQRR